MSAWFTFTTFGTTTATVCDHVAPLTPVAMVVLSPASRDHTGSEGTGSSTARLRQAGGQNLQRTRKGRDVEDVGGTKKAVKNSYTRTRVVPTE